MLVDWGWIARGVVGRGTAAWDDKGRGMRAMIVGLDSIGGQQAEGVVH